jgi:hypothetical protein
MPRVLLFAPCERVIIEHGANTISLIALLQNLNLPLPESIPTPAKALASIRWYALAIWRRDDDDATTNYQQRVALRMPDGSEPIEALTDFVMSKEQHRNIVQFQGLPVGQQGECTLTLSYRQTGDEHWTEVGAYPLQIRHITPSSTATH